jgi:hypothetical protein
MADELLETMALMTANERAVDERMAKAAVVEPRGCTCYPGEGPVPCQRKHAYHECWRAAVLEETRAGIVQIKGRDRQPVEQALLDYMMRVRTALEFY